MNDKVNGWPTIARYLDRRGEKQCDLARKLRLSPAAVTQIKKGETLLNPEQLSCIVEALGIAESDLTELYSDIFNARILRQSDSAAGGRFEVKIKKRCRRGYLPVEPERLRCDIEALAGYEPAIERLSSFVRRRVNGPQIGEQLLCDLGGAAGYGLPSGSTLLLAADEYPAPDDLVLAAVRGEGLLLLRYLPGDGCVMLQCEYAGGGDHLWDVAADPGYVRWMRPVLEIAVSFRG